MTGPATPRIPGWPILRIRLTQDGAEIDGTPIRSAPGEDPRQTALRAAAATAVQLGRPVRAAATDPDGTTWPLIIHPDGSATAIGEPIRPRRTPGFTLFRRSKNERYGRHR